jgi:putative membrane protein
MTNQPLVILSVDVDNDVSKAGVKTPIVGRQATLEAATKLALTSPEDTDVNAIFGAIKQFDQLKIQGLEDVEIAVVAGSVNGGVEADLNLRREVSQIVSQLKPAGVIFVSDGGDDERVIPIVQSLVPLYSVQRVTVQYSKGVEETYRVLASYIKKGFTEPRFIKYTLGVPGILILASAILAIVGLPQLTSYAVYVIALIVGAIMTIRGFKIPEIVENDWNREPIFFIGRMVSAVVLLVAIITDVEIVQSSPNSVSAGLSLIIHDTLDYYILAVVIYFSSIIATSYMESRPHFWKDVTAIAFVLSMRPAVFSIVNTILTDITSIAAVEQFLIKMFSAMVLTVSVAILSLWTEKWIQTKFFGSKNQIKE